MADAAGLSLSQHNVRHFDQEAQKWDEKPYIREWGAKLPAAYQQAGVQLTSDTVLLDFGCGTGVLSENVAAYVKQVVGVDTSPKMVERYNEKAAVKGLSNMTAVSLDVTDDAAVSEAVDSGKLPAAFDVICVHMSLHHVEHVQRALASLSKLLKPGTGLLLVTDLAKGPNSELFHNRHSHSHSGHSHRHGHGSQHKGTVHDTVSHAGGFDEQQMRDLAAGADCELQSFNGAAVPFTKEVEHEDGTKSQEAFNIFLLVAKKKG